jgi:hypothetical protein
MSTAATDISLLIVDEINCIEGYLFHPWLNKRSSQINYDLIYKIIEIIWYGTSWHPYDPCWRIMTYIWSFTIAYAPHGDMILICPKQDNFLYRITVVGLIKVVETGLFKGELIMWSRRERSDIPLILQNKDKLTAHGWVATFISCIYNYTYCNVSARFLASLLEMMGLCVETDRQTDRQTFFPVHYYLPLMFLVMKWLYFYTEHVIMYIGL